jgi:hypothetical protein
MKITGGFPESFGNFRRQSFNPGNCPKRSFEHFKPSIKRKLYLIATEGIAIHLHNDLTASVLHVDHEIP